MSAVVLRKIGKYLCVVMIMWVAQTIDIDCGRGVYNDKHGDLTYSQRLYYFYL
jgi:hypothetical protein